MQPLGQKCRTKMKLATQAQIFIHTPTLMRKWLLYFTTRIHASKSGELKHFEVHCHRLLIISISECRRKKRRSKLQVISRAVVAGGTRRNVCGQFASKDQRGEGLVNASPQQKPKPNSVRAAIATLNTKSRKRRLKTTLRSSDRR